MQLTADCRKRVPSWFRNLVSVHDFFAVGTKWGWKYKNWEKVDIRNEFRNPKGTRSQRSAIQWRSEVVLSPTTLSYRCSHSHKLVNQHSGMMTSRTTRVLRQRWIRERQGVFHGLWPLFKDLWFFLRARSAMPDAAPKRFFFFFNRPLNGSY